MKDLNIELLKRALDDNYVLVLTTNSNERAAVTKVLASSAKVQVPIDNDGARIGVCGEQLIIHITGTSGGQSDKAVGRITRRIISNPKMPKPKAVIIAGIAWGAPGVCSLDDVILSGELIF